MASNCTVTPIYPKTLITSSHLLHNPRIVAPKPSSTHCLHLVSSVRFNSLDHRRSTPPYSVPHAFRIPGFGFVRDEKPSDMVLLPGCDFKHWLVVMEFPKDPAPTREQMIDTYLRTLASVVGSLEKAKKSMYAFSTTTYTGFQCTVSEETSKKFEELPGVVLVLPDSYIDVKNKDYGGDKLSN